MWKAGRDITHKTYSQRLNRGTVYKCTEFLLDCKTFWKITSISFYFRVIHYFVLIPMKYTHNLFLHNKNVKRFKAYASFTWNYFGKTASVIYMYFFCFQLLGRSFWNRWHLIFIMTYFIFLFSVQFSSPCFLHLLEIPWYIQYCIKKILNCIICLFFQWPNIQCQHSVSVSDNIFLWCVMYDYCSATNICMPW